MARKIAPPRPRKRFGQHFLADQSVAVGISELICPSSRDIVVEIGPGRGALTRRLLERVERLVAVELDRDLVAVLRTEFDTERLHLIEADILNVDLKQIVRNEAVDRLVIVGNLPYNISAPLLFRLIAQATQISTAVLMLQREVALRLTASPGNRQYGLLTVLVSRWADIDTKIDVPPRCFRPVPRVDSSVVELRFLDACRRPVFDEATFVRVLRTVFGQRRKMLRNSLRSLVPDGCGEGLEQMGRRADIDLSRRPETLTLEEFSRLGDVFSTL